MYYHGSQAVLKLLNVITAATAAGKSTIIVEPGAPESSSNKFYYHLATDTSGLYGATYGSAITVGNWTELTANGLEVTASTNTVVEVVEIVVADSKPVAYGTAILNKG